MKKQEHTFKKISEAHKSDLVFYDMQTTNLHINVKFLLENFNFQKQQTFQTQREKLIICFVIIVQDKGYGNFNVNMILIFDIYRSI